MATVERVVYQVQQTNANRFAVIRHAPGDCRRAWGDYPSRRAALLEVRAERADDAERGVRSVFRRG